MYKLSIQSNKGPLEVSWADVVNLAKYANIQAGHYLDESGSFSPELLHRRFHEWHQTLWDMEQQAGMLEFPDGAIFVDIGSGIGVKDLLLSQYVPNSKFHLIDDEGWDEEFAITFPPPVCFDNTYPIYNSWEPLKDAICTSYMDPSRFEMQIPTDEFPQDVDVIFSQLSWCFHYPKEMYWDKVMSSLKTGGKLQLDVRLIQNQDVIGEISEALKSTPIELKFPKIPDFADDYPVIDPAHMWSRCMWTKNV